MMEEKSNTTTAADHSALLKQALRTLEQMKQKLNAAEACAHQPIAIVGLGCRFPGGVQDAESFWDLLRDGREAISEVPADRWTIDDYYDPDPSKPGRMVSRFGGFLSNIDLFDAAFFGIAPREASMMDPQQRLLLEVAWEAMESAGIAPRSLAGSRTGMYLGIASGDYAQLQLHAGDPSLLDVHYASGNAHSIASGRLSYLLGLKGPSVSVDTACSSSLVAVHLACQALRAGECTMAIAGGVNIILAPETTVALSHAHMMSPDGRSKAFDDRADGFARAEGCGLVLLKPLDKAMADGDAILAVIRGTALNQDGASSSLTAPHGPSQVELMRRALDDAGRVPSQVAYVEAHGTGTSLGDPIELQALGSVYGASRDPGSPLLVGSLKTNVGHMEAAAGVGGLIKLVLALQNGEIPAHLLVETPTRHVAWDALRLALPMKTMPWPAMPSADGKELPRLGAVSSFGFSGTNAHLIVEQAPENSSNALGHSNEKDAGSVPEDFILPLSASSGAALSELVQSYVQRLRSSRVARDGWADIACTASVGRDHLRHRIAVVASDQEHAAEALLGLSKQESRSSSDEPSICFLFTGQGSECRGMGLELLQASPVFRTAIERLEFALDGILGCRIETIWAGDHGELGKASLVQPALFAYGWALSELWRSWGVEPTAVLGHSLGEYIAAAVAGVFSPEEGVRLVAARGRLTEQLAAPGGMIAFVSSERQVRDLLAGSPKHQQLSIAAINGPASIVVSGPIELLEEFEVSLQAAGLRYKRLSTTHGFHSAAMDGMLDAFAGEASKVTFRVPEVRWISNLTGEVVARQRPVDAQYWRRHLHESVQFENGLATSEAVGTELFLELGAQPQLMALAEANGIAADKLVASIRRGGADSDWRKLLTAASRLYTRGVNLDWRGVIGGRSFRRVSLPTYPFQRQRFWFTDHRVGAGPQQAASWAGTVVGEHPLLAARLRTRAPGATFQSELTPSSPVHLGDHVVLGRRILPGAAYLEMAISSMRLLGCHGEVQLFDVEFREPCIFDEPRLLETVISSVDASTGRSSFVIASSPLQVERTGERNAEEWTEHATGFVSLGAGDNSRADCVDIFGLQTQATNTWSREAFYARFKEIGLEFGPALCTVAQAWGSRDEGLVELGFLDSVTAESGRYGIHPVVLDACLQAAAALDTPAKRGPALPAALERFTRTGDPAALSFAYARVRKRNGRALTVDITGLAADGQPILTAEGLTLVEAIEDGYRGWLHEVVWEHADFPWEKSVPISASDAEAAIALDAASLRLGLDEAAERNKLGAFEDWLRDFDELCLAWLVSVFADGGFALTPGREFYEVDFLRCLAIAPQHHRLAQRFLDSLLEFGYLGSDGDDRYTVLERESLDIERTANRLRYANHPEMAWTERCLPQLLHLLQGSVNPVDALFAEDGKLIARRLYRESLSSRVLNATLTEAAVQAAAQRNGRARVLEVGGGTASATSFLVPALAGRIAAYVFTDVGAGFVSAARQEFGDVPGMRFQTLDLEQDPSVQGLGGELFDVVIASNVLHATADLRQTLRHVALLLAPGGILLMAETLAGRPWIDMTVGFTEGWWRFTDHDVRARYPLLGKNGWISLLAESGFADVSVLPDEERGVLSRQCIFAAVRQQRDRLASVEQTTSEPQVLIIGSSEAEQPRRFTESLAIEAERHGAKVTIASANDDPDLVIATWFGMDKGASSREPGHWTIFYAAGAAGIEDSIESFGNADVLAWQDAVAGRALAWTRALIALDCLAHCRLWLISRGAFEPHVTSPAGASFSGFVRSLRGEFSEAQAFAFDLEQGTSREQDEARRLWHIAQQAPASAIQLALREGQVWVPRLAPYQLATKSADGFVHLEATQTRRLHLASSGLLEDAVPSLETRRQPGAEEVEIAVAAAALNFHEVLAALEPGALHEIPPGGECAGVVVAVGADVHDLQLGDEIVAIGSGLLCDFATLGHDRVWKKPARLSLEESGTLLIPFLTARWSLKKIARVRPGEQVLIHAGAGGVGLAAIQESLRLGARVFATAGSEAKRAFLRAYGVEGVFDSRSTAFEADVMIATGFQGVDVVLNSLGGDLVAASLRCVAPRGRFLELGEQTALTDDEARAIRPDIEYHRIHLRTALAEATPEVREIIQAMLLDAEAGVIQPLPFKAFPLAEAAGAFQFMAAARHTGRILLTPGTVTAGSAFSIRRDGAYIVTGGLTGLGRLTVEWLAGQGAGCVLALGRRAPDAETQALFKQLRENGTEILTPPCDVSQRPELAVAMDSIPGAFAVRGVFHAAGVLEDASLPQQTAERFRVVMAAKVGGAWNLHALTGNFALDCFVLYSSAAGLLGARGQANHAAANACMDALAHARREHLGLTALSINWGAWSGTGAAVRHSVLERSERAGASSISPSDGLRILGRLLETDCTQVLVSPVNWRQWAADSPAMASANADLLTNVLDQTISQHARQSVQQDDTAGSAKLGKNPQTSWRDQLLANDFAQQLSLLEARVEDRIRSVLFLPTSQVLDPTRPLQEYGLDSLLSIELRNALSADLDTRLPATTLFDYPTLASLTNWLFHHVLKAGVEPGLKHHESTLAVDVIQEVATLSDDEVERLFQQKMAGMRP